MKAKINVELYNEDKSNYAPVFPIDLEIIVRFEEAKLFRKVRDAQGAFREKLTQGIGGNAPDRAVSQIFINAATCIYDVLERKGRA